MKESRKTFYTDEEFQIISSFVKKNPKHIFDSTITKENEITKTLKESNYTSDIIKKPKIKSAFVHKIPLKFDVNINSISSKSVATIYNKQSIFSQDYRVPNNPNKRIKKKVNHNICDSLCDIFQIIKSASDSDKLKNSFNNAIITTKLEKEKHSETGRLCSVFNCLIPVSIQSKSEQFHQPPLFKNNFAKGDYNMSEEEKQPDDVADIKEEVKEENVPTEETSPPPPPADDTGAVPEDGVEAPTPEEEQPPPPEETPPAETDTEESKAPVVGSEPQTSGDGKDRPSKEKPAPAQDLKPEKVSETVPTKTASSKEGSKDRAERPSVETDVPYTHSSVLEGLAKAKDEAAVTTNAIMQLKNKILAYQQKEHLTPEDVAEMQATQAELMEKLSKYGDTSRYISGLVGMAEVPSSQLDMSMPPIPRKPALPKNDKTTSASVMEIIGLKEKATIGPPIPGMKEVDDIYLKRYSEEKLPQVIVCGMDSIDQVPKLIVCEPLKKADIQPFQKSQKPLTGMQGQESNQIVNNQPPPPPTSERSPISPPKKQMPPTQPGIDKRGSLGEQLADKQQAIEKLHTVINCLKDKVRTLNEENIELHRQQAYSSQPPQPKICRRELYQKVKKTLPPFEKRNGDNYDEDMEQSEEENLPTEIAEMQDKRYQLDSQPYCMNSGQQPKCKLMLPKKETQTMSEAEKDKKLRLMEEQCKKLNKDFNKKVTELSILKVELDKTKKEVENTRDLQKETENLLQNSLQAITKLEAERNKLLNFKEQYDDMEQDANLAKQMYITGQEELEESRMLFEDISKHLEDYRGKYLHTLTTLEEQKKDADRKYQEHEEQVQAEIQRSKLQIQEMEEELKTNKFLLKETQQKLKETQQMHAIALNNINDLSQDHINSKKEIDKMRELLNKSKSKVNEEKIAALEEKLKSAERRAEKLDSENQKLMSVLSRVQETARENERLLEEKIHETKLLQSQMETLREESARQISRSKGTFETMKSSMQAQISKLEAEIIQTRTAAYVAKQDKIAVQKKMQMQIANLTSSVNEAQTGVQSLQGHIMYLKGSQSNLFGPENVSSQPSENGDTCSCPPNCHKPYLKPELLAAERD